jgi:ABC-2 type transport system ATP-binding protein
VSAVTEAELVVGARGATKWFGETTALDEVDLLVGPGVVHGLLGPNGAGRTTAVDRLTQTQHRQGPLATHAGPGPGPDPRPFA